MTVLLADGFEKAIIGVARRCGEDPIVCYDRAKCIKILIKRDKMTWLEAEEYFTFNVEGAWVGKQTPVFMEKMDIGEIKEACEEDAL